MRIIYSSSKTYNKINMDLRIVNTCNNNCLYCLEQSYRLKEKYIYKNDIFLLINKNLDDNITFYWWNPLLHPDIIEIVKYSFSLWYKSIWILTNSYWLDNNLLNNLIENWLSSIWLYFNSFNREKHNLIVNWWIDYDEFINNLSIISKTKLFLKVIIHVNNENINSIYKDLLILNKKFWIKNFEFINYFPFDRPYDLYKNILEFDEFKNKDYINNIFIIIEKLKLNVSFVKFPKSFFWKYIKYYDFSNWILNQIGEEDINRLDIKEKPFCFLESRCNSCFIRDNCKFYE